MPYGIMVHDGDRQTEMSYRLAAMRAKEVSAYAVPDYLSEGWQRSIGGADSPISLHGGDPARYAAAASTSTAVAPSPRSVVVSPTADNDGDFSASPSPMTEVWREKICEWYYEVVDHFDFNREVVAIALSFLDRYVAPRASTVRRGNFCLASVTALYLAVKINEPGKLRLSSVVSFSRGYYAAKHIVAMERSMLQELQWRVHPPTAAAYCRDLVRLVSGDIDQSALHGINELARFLTELSVCDYWFATKRPSSVALASIINSIELQSSQGFPDSETCKLDFLHGGIDAAVDVADHDEIVECYERLRTLYIAGGYAPDQQRRGEGSPVVAVDSVQAKDHDVPRVAVARVASPSAVVPESPPGVRKRRLLSSARCDRAKRARKNLSDELNKEGEDLL